MLIFGIKKGFLTNLLFTSPKSLKKHTVWSFLGIMKDRKAHSDAGCLSSTPSLHSLSTSFLMVSLWTLGTGKARPWWSDTSSFNWNETGLVFQSPKVPSKSNSHFLSSCSNFFWWSALRCLQLFRTIDWRSAFLYLATRIRVTRLVASYVLCGSMARLWLSFSARRVLEPCR